jgi:hypothetical protein
MCQKMHHVIGISNHHYYYISQAFERGNQGRLGTGTGVKVRLEHSEASSLINRTNRFRLRKQKYTPVLCSTHANCTQFTPPTIGEMEWIPGPGTDFVHAGALSRYGVSTFPLSRKQNPSAGNTEFPQKRYSSSQFQTPAYFSSRREAVWCLT